MAVSPSILPDIHTGLSIAKAYGIYRANRSLLCSAFTPTCFYLDYIWQKSKEINEHSSFENNETFSSSRFLKEFFEF